MARARNIKPAFFTNDDMVELPFETRLLFIGLWTLADREGRLIDRPKKIKMEVFPSDNVDCVESLQQLEKSGFIARYEFGNHKVIEIVKFLKHQSPHTTEKDSDLPCRNGFFTVNQRTNKGVITGKPSYLTEDQRSSNVKTTLDNVNPPVHNALIPDSGFLNPESLLLIPDTGIPSKPFVEQRCAKPDHDPAPGIFSYWQKVMNSPRAKLDKKRIDRIRAGLKLGYTPRELCEAIKGCSRSPWNMGQNDRNTKYNSLELILRDADHIDKFMELADKETVGEETMEQRNARIMAEFLRGPGADDPNIIDMED